MTKEERAALRLLSHQGALEPAEVIGESGCRTLSRLAEWGYVRFRSISGRRGGDGCRVVCLTESGEMAADQR